MLKRPGLDVSDVLDDPDFNEGFVLIRRHRTDENGRGVVHETTQTLLGVIQPSSPKTLERLNQGDWKVGGIDIWCRKQIGTNTNKFLPDEVVWNNNRYICMADQDWHKYGNGYWQTTALLVYGEDGYDMASVPFGGVEIGVDPEFDVSVKRMLANATINPVLNAGGDLNA